MAFNHNIPLAIYLQDFLDKREGKMGHGVLRFSTNPIICVIDSNHTGKSLQTFVDADCDCPIVKDISQAWELGAKALVLGAAPLGGQLSPQWQSAINEAISIGFSIINGSHVRLNDRYPNLNSQQWVWDIRQEPANLTTATGAAATLNNKRILMIGNDMAIGKMTAGLTLNKIAQKNGIDSRFLATGQNGITISGAGIALDAIRLDFACGAVEQMVMQHQHDLIIVEGQGSLLHPSSSATLPLMRGSCPTHLILCHNPRLKSLAQFPDIKIPPLNELISLYEQLAASCSTFPKPKTIAICLNTSDLTDDEAKTIIAKTEKSTNIFTTDIVRYPNNSIIERFKFNI